ncbi:hypothetical protein CH354_16095 [Leptospira levettii]|uniref:NAD-dependent epimerase/dehydratase family protein n=1 Tax=Leptospira levettii TaxID=2023178 RepID=UPI000C2A1232|nr:NAD-dependent epimerase/dehydratase family protein [Leptospira levettii]MCW7472052.1 NAD-dependent epimerase/dehydratase family protein [Leptospira levettii]PJZ36180.1 hypothetical protein CH354_16095 [Leptospira levettii]PJZ90166.1 hypothetical protein CH368_03115 [Leptospira levettii]PJZ99847.1 hypothetical protein CH369_12145 [Leptospira levettii]
MAKLKLLVIGGTGFIGSHIVQKGIDSGFEVTSLSLKKKANIDKVISIQADLSDRVSVRSILSSERYDYVIHCGGYIDHTLFQNGGLKVISDHLTSLFELVSALDRTNLKKFLYLGSSDEYGNAPSPQKEEFREDPISPYSFAKASASHFLQMLWKTEKFPASVARLFLTYGPGQDDKRFLPQIIKGCLSDSVFPSSLGEQSRDFCYISDTVEGCFKILETNEANGEIFNIASGEKITIRQIIEKVVSIIGKGKPDFGKVPYRIGENMSLVADISKAKRMLHWKPNTSLDMGLKKTIEYFQ